MRIANPVRRLWLVLTLVAAASGAASGAADEAAARTTADAEIKLLTTLRYHPGNYSLLQDLADSDPDVVYRVLEKAWKSMPDATVREVVLDLLVNGTGLRVQDGTAKLTSYRPNPHLLDILALALTDPTPQVRKQAAECLAGIAFREIKTPEQFRQWRHIAGDRSIYEIIETNCRATLRSLDMARTEEKAPILRRLLEAPFACGVNIDHGDVPDCDVRSSGLTVYRRRVAESAGVVEIAARCLRPGNPAEVRGLAVMLLARFPLVERMPPELAADLQREMPEVMDRLDAREIYYLLGPFKARWVTDLLIERLQRGDARFCDKPWVIGKLVQSADPRAIPCLIAFFDTVEQPDRFGIQETIERGLVQFTKTPYRMDGERDGDWWRDWWRMHKQEFPPEARAIPIPNLSGPAGHIRFATERHVEYREVADAADAGYWLISSGVAAASEGQPPGLMVVLSNGAYPRERTRVWQETAGQAWDGRYVVAYIARSAAKPGAGSAEMPVRERLAEVVRDARSRASIDPRRVFLCGEGDAGLAAYACSLEKSTPFHGFLLLSSPFRSAQLPSLAMAKGRRYYLLHDKSDKTAPYFLAEAAQSMLKRQGAYVNLANLEERDTRSRRGTRNFALRQAIQWLEANR